MQRLAAEVKELRATPPLPLEQSQAVLTAAAGRLGERARLTLQGSRATLAITGLPADELSAWLAEVRSAGRARVLEAQLSRTPQGLYSGSVVLGLGGGS
jgi:general secretion pathway protein M